MFWFVAMIFAIPLLWFSGARGPKLRTWGAMFSASAVAWLLWLAGVPVPAPGVYLGIDLLAGAIVLKTPRGLPQRAIGLMFVGLALYDVGFILSKQNSTALYMWSLAAIGWLQFACLWGWGLYDTIRLTSGGPWIDRGVAATIARRVR